MSDDLDDLLADLAAAAEADAARGALGDQAPALHRVVTRVRRRRAARRTGAGVAVACAAGAVAIGVTQVRPDPRPAPAATAIGDWPGQFGRCGHAIDDVLSSTDDAVLSAKLTRGSAAIGVDTTMAGPDGVEQGWVYGTELTVVDDDGVVVGVQEGPSVPALADIDDYYAAASFASAPFPIRLHQALPLVSCDQYPDGNGDVALGLGEYQVWVTQTVGYTVGGTTHAARANVELPLVVGPGHTLWPGEATPGPTSQPTPPPGSADPTEGTPAADLFRCGKPVDVTIHTLPDANGFTLAADLPDTGWGEATPGWSVTVGSSGDKTRHAYGSPAGDLALVDSGGVVAGFVVPGHGPQRTVSVGPGTTDVLDGPTLVVPCSDQPLHGTYTAWPFVVMTPIQGVTADGQALDPGAQVVVVANPRKITFDS